MTEAREHDDNGVCCYPGRVDRPPLVCRCGTQLGHVDGDTWRCPNGTCQNEYKYTERVPPPETGFGHMPPWREKWELVRP